MISSNADGVLLSTTEFARTLGIHPNTLIKWEKRAQLLPVSRSRRTKWYASAQLARGMAILRGCAPGEVTTAEICERAAVSRDVLYNYIAKGFITPHRKNGRYYLWLPAQVAEVRACWHRRSEEVTP